MRQNYRKWIEKKTTIENQLEFNAIFHLISGLLYNPFVPQMHSNEPPSADSPSSVEGTGEQPLDLSAKPSSGSPSFSNDSKQICRYVSLSTLFHFASFRSVIQGTTWMCHAHQNITNDKILAYHIRDIACVHTMAHHTQCHALRRPSDWNLIAIKMECARRCSPAVACQNASDLACVKFCMHVNADNN